MEFRKKHMAAKPKKEIVEDVVKTLLQWIVVSALGFGYWMFLLLLISIFLVNVWIVSFERILLYGIILAAVTSLAYAGVLLYRKLH